jgi:hypothetical protein
MWLSKLDLLSTGFGGDALQFAEKRLNILVERRGHRSRSDPAQL